MQKKPVSPVEFKNKPARLDEVRPLTQMAKPMEVCFTANQRPPCSPLDVLIESFMEDPERWDGLS